MAITLPTIFSQFDTRWSQVLLGFNSSPQYTLYNSGCLLSNVASVCKYYGIDTDPLRLNQLCKDHNAFEVNSGEYIWGKLGQIFPDLSDSLVRTPDILTDAQMGEIKNRIDSGIPVLLWIDYNPRTVQNDMHWVIAIAYNPMDENDFLIADPLGGKVHTLKDYLGWLVPSARKSIAGYGVISGKVPSVNTVSVNADVFPHLVHGDTQWEKIVASNMPDADPNVATYEDLAKVIGGIKSRATDLSNQLTKQVGDLAEAQQQAKNCKEQLANEQAQRQADQKMYLTQLQALKSSGQHIDQISQSYDARVKGLQEQIDGLLQDKSILANQNARLSSSPNVQAVSWVQANLPTFLSWIRSLKTK